MNTNGELARTIGDMVIPYDVAKIQRDTKWFTVDTIRIALELYKKLGLVYELPNGILKIRDYDRMVGQETNWAEQKRLQNEKKFLLSGGNFPPDSEETV
jgi:hypothetical protein